MFELSAILLNLELKIRMTFVYNLATRLDWSSLAKQTKLFPETFCMHWLKFTLHIEHTSFYSKTKQGFFYEMANMGEETIFSWQKFHAELFIWRGYTNCELKRALEGS